MCSKVHSTTEVMSNLSSEGAVLCDDKLPPSVTTLHSLSYFCIAVQNRSMHEEICLSANSTGLLIAAL